MNVVLVDNNKDNLEEAQKVVKGEGKVEIVQCDVSQVEEFTEVVGLVEHSFDGE